LQDGYYFRWLLAVLNIVTALPAGGYNSMKIQYMGATKSSSSLEFRIEPLLSIDELLCLCLHLFPSPPNPCKMVTHFWMATSCVEYCHRIACRRLQ